MRLLSFFNAAGLCSMALALVLLVTAPVDSKVVALLAGGVGFVMFLIAHSPRK